MQFSYTRSMTRGLFVFIPVFLLLSPLLLLSCRAGTESLIRQVIDAGSGALNSLRTKILFDNFIKKEGKNYSGKAEYLKRLRVFRQNIGQAIKNQALDPTAIHGITPFSDLTPQEFESRYTGLLSPPPHLLNSLPAAQRLPTHTLPKNFDWRDKGAVTNVKTQGNCGSCWAFSTTGVLEGANFVSTGRLLNLSEQQLVDCDHKCDEKEKDACDSGCGGGLMTNAYKYVMEAGGLASEEDYPYKGIAGPCQLKEAGAAVRLVNFSAVEADEGQMAAHLVRNGPLAVGVNAVFMHTYVGGVSCPIICSKRHVNHGVLVVGFGAKGFAPLRVGYRPYWIIKNSWGQSWGEKGYYRLCRGHGQCGVNTMASAVTAVARPRLTIDCSLL